MNAYFSYEADWLKQRNAWHTAAEIWQQPDLWAALHRQLQDQQAQWQPFLAPLLANPRLQIVLCGARQFGVRRPGSGALAARTHRPRRSGLRHHRYRRQPAAVPRP